METIEFLALREVVTIWLIAFGIAYVITISKIGLLLRVPWCFLLKWNAATRFLWNFTTCPPCNSWWGAALIAYLWGSEPTQILQAAFVSAGLTAAVVWQTGLSAPEDMEKVLGIKEKEDGSQ
jgi:hypothetical protein